MKQQLASYSKRVAGSVTELIQAAEAMKGILTYHLFNFNNRMKEEQTNMPRGVLLSLSLHLMVSRALINCLQVFLHI